MGGRERETENKEGKTNGINQAAKNESTNQINDCPHAQKKGSIHRNAEERKEMIIFPKKERMHLAVYTKCPRNKGQNRIQKRFRLATLTFLRSRLLFQPQEML